MNTERIKKKGKGKKMLSARYTSGPYLVAALSLRDFYRIHPAGKSCVQPNNLRVTFILVVIVSQVLFSRHINGKKTKKKKKEVITGRHASLRPEKKNNEENTRVKTSCMKLSVTFRIWVMAEK